MKKILIIEDESNISDFVKMELEYEGYEAEISEDGKEGLIKALREDYDLIVLDLMLPGISGLEVCRRLKKEKDIPVIMLSAKDSVMDKVAGLQIGADDYIAKPFAIEELIARIQVIFRRTEKVKSNIIKFKDLSIQLESRTVMKNEEKINLTNKGKVVTRDNILNEVWGYDYDAGTNVVDVYVSYLRNKLDEKNKEAYIETVRAVGYIISEK